MCRGEVVVELVALAHQRRNHRMPAVGRSSGLQRLSASIAYS